MIHLITTRSRALKTNHDPYFGLVKRQHFQFKSSATFRVTAVITMFAAIFIHEVGATFGAFLLLDGSAVRDIAAEGACDTIFPSVDVIFFNVKVLNKSNNVSYWHSMAQHAGDKFRIVPVFLIKGA